MVMIAEEVVVDIDDDGDENGRLTVCRGGHPEAHKRRMERKPAIRSESFDVEDRRPDDAQKDLIQRLSQAAHRPKRRRTHRARCLTTMSPRRRRRRARLTSAEYLTTTSDCPRR